MRCFVHFEASRRMLGPGCLSKVDGDYRLYRRFVSEVGAYGSLYRDPAFTMVSR